jgi:tRNA pseudouridine38-40 synthase
MPHFKLIVAYDGAGFVGWQRQASGTSIQGLIEAALAAIDGREVDVAAAGRTDAGVHALGQVVSFTLQRAIDADTILRALNAHLPESIRVRAAQEAPPDFHARFSSARKTYRYRIWNGGVVDPFERGRVWQVPAPTLDVAAMARAAACFEGQHDFAAFQAVGGEAQTTVRTMTVARVDVEPRDRDALVTFTITGDGFLRHMVRIMAGTLVEVGRGRRDAASVEEALVCRARTSAGRTAPAEGLFLVGVEYEPSA